MANPSVAETPIIPNFPDSGNSSAAPIATLLRFTATSQFRWRLRCPAALSRPPTIGGGSPPDYRHAETKIQLSVRTKIAEGLIKSGNFDQDDQDPLWFGYSQQSYWQLFSSSLSRPFRTTDHEPELIYIYPHQIALPGGWNYRLSGLGLVHQSNEQSDLLSRS